MGPPSACTSTVEIPLINTETACHRVVRREVYLTVVQRLGYADTRIAPIPSSASTCLCISGSSPTECNCGASPLELMCHLSRSILIDFGGKVATYGVVLCW